MITLGEMEFQIAGSLLGSKMLLYFFMFYVCPHPPFFFFFLSIGLSCRTQQKNVMSMTARSDKMNGCTGLLTSGMEMGISRLG